MTLTPPWFGWLAARLREEGIAPVVFNMEGGYNPDNCVTATGHAIRGLSGGKSSHSFLDEMGLLGPVDTADLGDRTTLTTRGATIVVSEGDPCSFVGSFTESRGAQVEALRDQGVPADFYLSAIVGTAVHSPP